MRNKFVKELGLDMSAHKMSSYDVALREASSMVGREFPENTKK